LWEVDANASHSYAPTAHTTTNSDFPFVDMKVLASMGERSVCPDSLGEKLVGVPDGIGAYLVDDDTVRVVFQSESYGPIRFESYGFPVNDGSARVGGSHVQYIDYDRTMMSEFMDNDEPASSMVVGMGQMISTMYNLKGEMVRACCCPWISKDILMSHFRCFSYPTTTGWPSQQ
jgi:hypothetical protein